MFLEYFWKSLYESFESLVISASLFLRYVTQISVQNKDEETEYIFESENDVCV